MTDWRAVVNSELTDDQCYNNSANNQYFNGFILNRRQAQSKAQDQILIYPGRNTALPVHMIGKWKSSPQQDAKSIFSNRPSAWI